MLGAKLADVQAGRATSEPSPVADWGEAPTTEPAAQLLTRHGSPRRRLVYAAVVIVAFLAGGLTIAELTDFTHFLHTPVGNRHAGRGDLQISGDGGVEHIAIRLGDKEIATVAAANPNTTLDPGTYDFHVVAWPGFKVKEIRIESTIMGQAALARALPPAARFSLTLGRAEKAHVFVLTEPEPGWVQLSLLNDERGWDTGIHSAAWKIEDGELIGAGKNVSLATAKPLARDFHLRMQVKLNDGDQTAITFGNPAQTVRIGINGDELWASYEAPNEQPKHTEHLPGLAGTWISVDVLAEWGRIEVQINGKQFIKGQLLQPLQLDRSAPMKLLTPDSGREVRFRNVALKGLSEPAVNEPGWVQLFNGKDLSGWKMHEKQPKGWQVKDGVLEGSGPYVSHLFTERGNFADFHLRAQVKINDQGNSGIYFRVPFDVSRLGMFPTGYEAQILNGLQYNRGNKVVENNLTGSLYGLAPFDKLLVLPDTWFTLEVIAKDNHIVIKVNGQTTVDYHDPERRRVRGHLALQMASHAAPLSPPTVVQFKKIEIKEPPPEEPAWVQFFNGKAEFINPAGDCKAVADKGALRITVPGTARLGRMLDPATDMSAPRILQEVEGDFVAQLRVYAFPRPGPDTARNQAWMSLAGAGLLVWHDQNRFAYIFREEHEKEERGSHVAALSIQPGAGKIDLPTQVGNFGPKPPNYLQIERRGRVVTMRQSNDGKAWQDVYTREMPLTEKLKVGVVAQNNTNVDYTFTLEDFKLDRAQ